MKVYCVALSHVWETAINVKPFKVNFDWQICRKTTCVLRWLEHAQSRSCDTLQSLQTWKVFPYKYSQIIARVKITEPGKEKKKHLKRSFFNLRERNLRRKFFKCVIHPRKHLNGSCRFWWVFIFNLLFNGAFFCWLLYNSSVLCPLFATVNNSGVMLANSFLAFSFLW